MVESHTNKKFIMFDAAFPDQTDKIERGPAVIGKKDIGMIMATTGINRSSKVVDIGTGPGMLALHLANVCDHVISYEKNPEVAVIAKKNMEKLGLKVTIKNKDAGEGIDEKEVDVMTIDLKEPWLILDQVHQALKSGGFAVAYCPQATQIHQFCNEAAKKNFYLYKVCELIEREWTVEDQKCRPNSGGIMHTGFLVFIRKY